MAFCESIYVKVYCETTKAIMYLKYVLFPVFKLPNLAVKAFYVPIFSPKALCAYFWSEKGLCAYEPCTYKIIISSTVRKWTFSNWE